MKKEILKAVAAVMALTLTASILASCGKSDKPTDLETYVAATVQSMESSKIDKLIQSILGDKKWDGDYSKLTEAERRQIEAKLKELGYFAVVTDEGISYYDYIPTPDEKEVEEVFQKVLGGSATTAADGKEETTKASSNLNNLTDEEKQALKKEFADRGYDVNINGDTLQFVNQNIRKEEETSPYYNQLPGKEVLSGALYDVLGMDGFNAWNGNFGSLTAAQKKEFLKKLNDYGYDLGINSKGELFILHDPTRTLTYDKAHTDAPIGGTTQPQTTEYVDPDAFEQPETPTKTAPKLKRTALSSYSGNNYRTVAGCKDGGFVAAGLFQTADGDYAGTDKTWQGYRASVVRYDEDGTVQWNSAVGGKDLNAMLGVMFDGVTELKDGSIVAVGYTDARSLGVKRANTTDAVIVKFSSSGKQEWVKLVEGNGADYFYSVAACPDGGFVVGGQTTSSDQDFDGLTPSIHYAILSKYKKDGTREWLKSFSAGTNAAQFTCVAVDDNGYIYAGCYAAVPIGGSMKMDMAQFAGFGKSDSIVFVLAPDGNSFKTRAIAGSGNDHIQALTISNTGGVVAAGTFTENNRADSVFNGRHNYGSTDAFVVGLSPNLEVEWTKTYGGIDNDSVTGICSIKNGYVISGYSTSANHDFDILGSGDADIFVFALSNNGSDTNHYHLKGNKPDLALGLASSSNKKLAVVGGTSSSNEDFNAMGSVPGPKGSPFFAMFELS